MHKCRIWRGSLIGCHADWRCFDLSGYVFVSILHRTVENVGFASITWKLNTAEAPAQMQFYLFPLEYENLQVTVLFCAFFFLLFLNWRRQTCFVIQNAQVQVYEIVLMYALALPRFSTKTKIYFPHLYSFFFLTSPLYSYARWKVPFFGGKRGSFFMHILCITSSSCSSAYEKFIPMSWIKYLFSFFSSSLSHSPAAGTLVFASSARYSRCGSILRKPCTDSRLLKKEL